MPTRVTAGGREVARGGIPSKSFLTGLLAEAEESEWQVFPGPGRGRVGQECPPDRGQTGVPGNSPIVQRFAAAGEGGAETL